MTREGCMLAGASSEIPFFIGWFLFGWKSGRCKSADEPKSREVSQFFLRGGWDGSKWELGGARLGQEVGEARGVAA